MRHRRFFYTVVLAFWAVQALQAAPIRYELSIGESEPKSFHVRITLETGGSTALRLAIPAWTPGYYQILNYHQDIHAFRAFDDRGEPLPVSKPGPHDWQIVAKSARTVVAEYDVRPRESGPGFFYTALGEKSGYVNGPAAFMYADGRKNEPVSLTLRLPASWKCATSLDPGISPLEFTAPNYDDFADCPLQLGHFDLARFRVDGIPISIAVTGAETYPRRDLLDTFSKIVRAGRDSIGGLPFARYLFILHFSGSDRSGGGGLEHGSSTVLNVSGSALKDIRSIAPLAAHEFFHAWNVKRIRSKGLGPFDYSQEADTGSLWFLEGVTDYYAYRLLYRAGLIDRGRYLDNLAGEIRGLLNNEARKAVSLEESGRRAWQGGSWGYGGLSYYNKGKLAGLLFDLKIRDITDGRKSLDDVMRLLMKLYGSAPEGFEADGILKAMNRVAGADLSREYEQWVRGTEELPFAKLLKAAGIDMVVRNQPVPFFGVSSEPDPATDLPRVLSVVGGSEAEKAGLQEGDLIASAGGSPMAGKSLASAVQGKEAGEPLRLIIRRSGEESEIRAFMGGQDRFTVELKPMPDPTRQQAARRRGWLQGEGKRAPENLLDKAKGANSGAYRHVAVGLAQPLPRRASAERPAPIGSAEWGIGGIPFHRIKAVATMGRIPQNPPTT
ncbi:MAG: M61 family metallopeptidase [Armatimonadetes bacterium]|nr:M61 family metallopeptidase [Armatimonadota bacterium]